MKVLIQKLLLCSVIFGFIRANDTGSSEIDSFQIITIRWDSVRTPFIIATWLVVAAIAKIAFRLIKPITTYLPDSSLLIVVGLAIGIILKQLSPDSTAYTLDSHIFFLYLLPPIIFDAGYFMPNRSLFENLDSIVLFSVVGTIWNTMAIGGSLLALSYYDAFSMEFSAFEIFVFSALISAVDPVPVIAVFEEINVNEFLFVNVFGEALFNDGVTVVLYQMFKSFVLIGGENLTPSDYGAAALSFFVVSLGGAAVGLIFAAIVSFATKHTNDVRLLAPVFIFVIPYTCYLSAEMVSLSPLIAIAVCGMAMKQYVKGNITAAAANSVKYFTKMLAQSAETVIFVFLGLCTIESAEYHWDIKFIVATVIFCLLWRTVGVILQCFVLNRFRDKKFTNVDQFILSYGGLRGTIAFGLAVSLPDSIEAKPMFITTTISIIFFTVFLQGITIKPLVAYLNVATKEDRQPTMAESVYLKYLDYMMSGVEDIAGQRGHYSLRENFERFNAKVLRPVLMRNTKKSDFDASTIIRAYAKITLEDALKLTRAHSSNRLQNMAEEVQHKSSIFERAHEREHQLQQMTVASKDKQLKKIIKSHDNVEGLYSMFSDLLDRKLDEINSKNKSSRDDEHDIKDDYMKQIESSSNLRKLASKDNMLDEQIEKQSSKFNKDRRQSVGGLVFKEKKKSPID